MSIALDHAHRAILDPRRAGRYAWLAWRESRPVVQVMFQLRFGVGALLSIDRGSAASPVLLAVGAASWLCATWYVYLLNGVCDQVEDLRNGSSRPIAAGHLPPAAARTILVCLAVAALALGVAVGWHLVLLVALLLGLGSAYSAGARPQKANVPGFIAVVVAGGLVTYLAGGVSAGRTGWPGGELAVLAVSMSLWMAFAGMTKDISDVPGDRAAGRRTLPVVLGESRARRVMALLALTVGVLALALIRHTALALLPMGVVLLCGAGLLAVSLFGVGSRAGTKPGRPYRVFMMTQYAAHVLVVVPLLR